jgi:hypothetical protein
MSKSNEDRLQEAIEDALDGRAITAMYDWRHPISAVSALSKLIALRQQEAVREASAIAYAQGHDEVHWWLEGYMHGVEARIREAKEKNHGN